jgi:hypothetical protein
MFYNTFFATAKYTAFVIIIKAATDTLCHKDLHLIIIKKTILFVNKRLQSITSVIQTRQAFYAVVLA